MKKIKAATDSTDYTDFMEISVPVRQRSVESVKSVAVFMDQPILGAGRYAQEEIIRG
jgi:hypothetical protein